MSTSLGTPGWKQTLTPELLRQAGNTHGPWQSYKITWHGAPLLDSRPLLRWLAGQLELHPEIQVDNLPGEKRGTTARALRRCVNEGQTMISEYVVERLGIIFAGTPRLAAELYPALAEPVCQMCGATRHCQHLQQSV